MLQVTVTHLLSPGGFGSDPAIGPSLPYGFVTSTFIFEQRQASPILFHKHTKWLWLCVVKFEVVCSATIDNGVDV